VTDETPPPSPATPTPPEPLGLPEARVEPRSRARLVWLLPILALLAIVILLLEEWRTRGPRIEVEVPRASGIEPGRTAVLSHGVPIGVVSEVRLDAAREHPIVSIDLHRWASAYATEGSVYWVVRPSIGFRGVSGLETLASGPVLEARAGADGAARRTSFVALARAPLDAASANGLAITLSMPKLGSIRPGSPVTYRDIAVGEVIDTRLADDSTKVLLDVLILPRYAPLVRTSTKFWNTSGFGVDLGVTGVKLRTESLEALLGGGIALATPSERDPQAAPGAVFDVAPEPEKEWTRWSPAIELAPGP
jgi:paraquat-inducible protein B